MEWEGVGGSRVARSFMACTARQVKECAMGRACSTNGEKGVEERKNVYSLLMGKPEDVKDRRNHTSHFNCCQPVYEKFALTCLNLQRLIRSFFKSRQIWSNVNSKRSEVTPSCSSFLLKIVHIDSISGDHPRSQSEDVSCAGVNGFTLHGHSV
jgi:hypothetical protein